MIAWRVSSFLFCFIVLIDGAGASVNEGLASKLKKAVVKDTTVSSVDRERAGNNGKSSRLKIKGIQECILFDIDASSLPGHLVKDARLHFRSAAPLDAPVKRAGISTLASGWTEGKSQGCAHEKGAACFVQAKYKKQDWAYPGSTLMDVVFGRGNTIWQSSRASLPDRDGWQEIRVPPDILGARVAGISKGFCFYDDVGSEWSVKNGKFEYRFFPNRLIYSRESFKSSPWMEIQFKGKDLVPPDPVRSHRVETKMLPSGEAFLFWKTPFDHGGGKTLGFDVAWKKDGKYRSFPRYLIPMAQQPGGEVRMHIRDLGFGPKEGLQIAVCSLDSAGNRSKPFFADIVLSGGLGTIHIPDSGLRAFPVGERGPDPSVNISVIDLFDKYLPEERRMIPGHDNNYQSANHIFSMKERKIRIYGARNEGVCFQVVVDGDLSGFTMECLFEDEPAFQPELFLFENVKVKGRAGKQIIVPDPLVSLGKQASKRLRNGRSILCEIYISHGVSPGLKKGKLIIKPDNRPPEVFDIHLTVWHFTLPDKLSFLPEMNAYSTVSPYKGYACYRLANRHRACLNRLPYGWDGIPEFAPQKRAGGFDWVLWDKKVGPLLDGSAFAGLPRGGQPVEVMYLPLSENWPVGLAEHYTRSWWADEALSDDYRKKLKHSFRAFARHIREKAWNRTRFQFYLNNKVYYKKRLKRSSAPWIFDEPVNIQDFMALEWYGRLWHEAVDSVKGSALLDFRADISYPQYGRDILRGVTDIEYIGGNNAQKTRMKGDEIRINPKIRFAEYGTANKLVDSNVQPALWCVSAWSKGASGILPWQTIGSDTCWNNGEQTALFYPRGDRVHPSVRLKTFRAGQQFVEYLELLADSLNLPDDAVRHWVKTKMNLQGCVYKAREFEAGTEKFETGGIYGFWKLRVDIGCFLSHNSP